MRFSKISGEDPSQIAFSPKIGNLHGVTICRELRYSDQINKSEHAGTDRRQKVFGATDARPQNAVVPLRKGVVSGQHHALSEYAQRFADNDIDFAILRDLTDQDLEKIGVASLAIVAGCCWR